MLMLDAAIAPPTIVVVGQKAAATRSIPNSSESVDAERLRETTNVRNAEDMLRYLPSLFVRKRHIGDTQAPVATRTSGVGASARSLIYADGVLLSALIGNNNSLASPRWGMVSPEEIERVEVRYGPFSARDPGNAIGAVVDITTRLPRRFEATATAAINRQSFDQYGTDRSYPATQIAGTIGDRVGPVAWFVAANHVDSRGQPLAYVTATRPATTSSAGAPMSGAFPDVNRLGQPIFVLGAGGIEHHVQDNLKLKLAADLGGSLRLTYLGGLFLNDTSARAETFLLGTAGPAFAGTLNIGGRAVTVPASSFSNQIYRQDQRHIMNALTLEQSGRRFSWSVIATAYSFDRDRQRIPSTALPGAGRGGAGSIVRLDGTGWRTLDLKGAWQAGPDHALAFGAHYDRFILANNRFATSDWRDGDAGALIQAARGRTRTVAVWAEDRWSLAPTIDLTLGARAERWRASRGYNFSVTPALARVQPERMASGVSPKASLRWRPDEAWSVTLSGARALRFPTVSELYQAISTGNAITVPDPTLEPERALSSELAVERTSASGRIRLSLFAESIRGALLSQTAPLVAGSPTLFNYVQNVGRVRTRGVELVFERRGILPDFDLSGSATLADPRIVSDPLFRAAEGKLIPQVPRRRATLVATWRPSPPVALTLAGRYSSRLYGTIDNSDVVGHTYQGFEGFFVADARASFRLSEHLRGAVGVENLTDQRYYLFHPFPGRTLTAEIGWKW